MPPTCSASTLRASLHTPPTALACSLTPLDWPCALPRRHTHERVDQLFSRISVELSRTKALTRKELHDVIRRAFTPSPNVMELPGVLGIQGWLDGHVEKLKNITNPHMFIFTPDPTAEGPVKSKIVCRLYSDTEDSAPIHALKRVPPGKPQYIAARHLFHGEGRSPEALEEAFATFEVEVWKTLMAYECSLEVVEEWESTIADLEASQVAPARAFDRFWPTSPTECADWQERLRVAATPSIGSESPSTEPDPSGDLCTPERVRLSERLAALEAQRNEMDFEPLRVQQQGGGAFDYFDAKVGNLVIIDTASGAYTTEERGAMLGDWEAQYAVGYVHKREKADDGSETLLIKHCEPWVEEDGVAVQPLWVANHLRATANAEPHPSTWEDVRELPWLPIRALPVATYNVFYRDHAAREVRPTRDVDNNFRGYDGVQAITGLKYLLDGPADGILRGSFDYNHLTLTCQVDKEEKEAGARVVVSAITRVEVLQEISDIESQLRLKPTELLEAHASFEAARNNLARLRRAKNKRRAEEAAGARPQRRPRTQ